MRQTTLTFRVSAIPRNSHVMCKLFMAAGLTSKAQFLENISLLCQLSDSINDGWKLETFQDEIVLCKTDIKQVTKPVVESGGQENDKFLEEDHAIGLDAEEDSACLPVESENVPETLKFEYNILYSESYSVPVLYLNVNKSDGKLLSLEELWNLIPQVYRERLEVDRWTFLTQQEHPLLGRPFYQLHPCHTERLMESVQQPTKNADTDLNKSRNYHVTWLGPDCPLVHLKLPPTFGQIT